MRAIGHPGDAMTDGDLMLTGVGALTRKQKRSAEEAAAVGGLRNPVGSLKHLPRARSEGMKLHAIPDDCTKSGWSINEKERR